MRKKKLFGFALLFVSLPFFVDFRAHEDFSWLREFIPLTETVTVEHWEKDPRITFDENGWVQVNKQSNPVTLSQYALVCFDTFRSTGDVKYKKAFLNQVRYLMSDKQYKELSGDRIGYPYNYIFHDLKPDWYSGLAQAEAICVLIRYYILTKDDKALRLIVKLKNQMLWPMEDGGLLAKTPEGGPWIEEYPNSKQNKHVLNGYLISVFGLYEYTMLFPEDREAKTMYQQCLQSLKTSVGNYDTGSWLQYDRGNKSGVTNWYMKAQVVEMKMLYNITNDPFFYRLHQLWSTYAYNKPLTYTGCKINDVNFSIPMYPASDGWIKPGGQYVNMLSSQDIRKFDNGSIFPNHGCGYLVDKSPTSYFQPLKNDTMNGDTYAAFDFKAPYKFDMISLANLKDSAVNYSVELEYKADSASKWKSINIKTSFSQGKENFYQFNEISATSFRINFKLKNNVIVMIAELSIQNSKAAKEAIFSHYMTEAMQVGKQRMKFSFDSKDAGNYTVFYKYGNSKSELMKAKWNPNDYTLKVPFETESCGSFYQYLIVFKIESPAAAIRNVKAE